MKKIAVLGYGVVGSGVVELFYKNKEKIEANAGDSLDIAYILDVRTFPGDPYASKVVHDIQLILDDPEVGYVAECMGGVTPAFEFVSKCLESGKSVATSNKQLVAEKGDILLQIAREHHVNFFFEASVGGAIPILRPLHTSLVANDIKCIAGILNGTTNFILEKMFDEQMQYDDALALAQKLGYVERDPSADIDGGDACRKVCILASLAYGKHVYPDQVYTKGIRNITLDDIQLADKFGGTVKLIGIAKRLDDGRVLPSVMPMVVMRDSLLSRVNGVFNGIMVWGDGFDKMMYYGRGAGKLPTASAVLGDIVDEIKLTDTDLTAQWEPVQEGDNFVAPIDAFYAPRCYRTSPCGKGVFARIAAETGVKLEAATENGCYISSCNQSTAEAFKRRLANEQVEILSRIPVLVDE